jgi:hypothetical protein
MITKDIMFVISTVALDPHWVDRKSEFMSYYNVECEGGVVGGGAS